MRQQYLSYNERRTRLVEIRRHDDDMRHNPLSHCPRVGRGLVTSKADSLTFSQLLICKPASVRYNPTDMCTESIKCNVVCSVVVSILVAFILVVNFLLDHRTACKQEVWQPGSADTVCPSRPPLMTQVQHFVS